MPRRNWYRQQTHLEPLEELWVPPRRDGGNRSVECLRAHLEPDLFAGEKEHRLNHHGEPGQRA